MKQYFQKKFEKVKAHAKGLHQKTIVRVWNLAKRMDAGRKRGQSN